uniref:Phosphoenolpyruvate carboxylase n=1 Tax=Meloidogyne hapla TaxID=6305 RepID=A0A1I8C0N1_MELHA
MFCRSFESQLLAVKDDVECMDKLGDWLVFSNKLEAYISSMMQRYNARGQAVGI